MENIRLDNLNYQAEEESVADGYRAALQNICAQKSKIFEADSEDDFRSGNLIEMERAAFPTWDEDAEKPEGYFEDIVKWFSAVNEDADFGGESRLDELERWMTVKSCKISDRNVFLMAPCHPVVKLLHDDAKRISEKYKQSIEKDSDISTCIKKSVVEDYLRGRERFYVYGTGQVYLSKRADGCRRAIPWKDVGTLTSFDSLRLLEKTISWVRRNVGNTDNIGSERNVTVAYIGTIDNPEGLQAYFDHNQVSVGDREVNVRVSLTRLERVPQSGKYIFRRTDDVREGKRTFDLSSLADMKALFEKFDMVLFLDESYFYRQGQARKGLSEKGAAEYIQWYQKKLEWELGSKGFSKDEEEAKKSYYYREIYNKAGLWMNGYGQDTTAKFSFDKDLFSTIAQAAANAECDVYLYISLGETIGDIDLSRQGVCNDERYGGKRLLVYKMPSLRRNETINDLVAEMLHDKGNTAAASKNQPGDNGSILADIDLWKLVKSIGSEFAGYLFSLLKVDGKEIYSVIERLRSSYLLVYVPEGCGEQAQLHFSLYLHNKFEESQMEVLREFARSFLQICKAETDVLYVKNYLYDLLVNAIFSRANSVKGIFYAYLMEQKRVTVSEEINEIQQYDTQERLNMFQARRTVYLAVKGLDQIVIRDMEKRWDILQYEFRYLYCKDISESTFTKMLGELNKYCVEAGYTDSKLYLLTKPERDIYGR